METSCSLISLGKKDYAPSLHSWCIRWSSPFIRKELCNCHNVSISKLPDPILTCDINSPSCKCPTSCNIVSPKSPPFPKHVLLGESFTVWPFALFLTWIEKKKNWPNEVLHASPIQDILQVCVLLNLPAVPS